MPTLSVVKGIKVYINWDDHLPPHFHAMFAGHDVSIDLETLEARGEFPKRQLRIILGWAECHRAELLDNGNLIAAKEDHYEISPEL